MERDRKEKALERAGAWDLAAPEEQEVAAKVLAKVVAKVVGENKAGAAAKREATAGDRISSPSEISLSCRLP